VKNCDPTTKNNSISENHIIVTLTINGIPYTAMSEFNETSLKAQGPMSLESGLMSLVRGLSQNLYRNWKDES